MFSALHRSDRRGCQARDAGGLFRPAPGDHPASLVGSNVLAATGGGGARAGGSRSRWAGHLDSRVVRRSEGWVQRFGAPAVTLGFLTVGVQTAINASAGMLRMPQRTFLPAVTLGAALWSMIYTTVGFTVVDAWLGTVSWWWALVAVAAVVAIFVLSGRLEESAKADDPSGAGDPATTA